MDEFGFSVTSTDFERDEGLSIGESVETCTVAQKLTGKALSEDTNAEPNSAASSTSIKSNGDFYNTALRILYTLTPAILILNNQRDVVFANRNAEDMLKNGDVIALNKRGHICCVDPVAQNFLLKYVRCHQMDGANLFSKGDGSFLIPKKEGWPIVAILGGDQLQSEAFNHSGFDAASHITLMIRDPNGCHPEQSSILANHFGLSNAENLVVKALVEGNSTDEIAQKRGVSVVTIRNQLKSAQSKMGVARQSELVSLFLRCFS
ncbi:MAG: helix-turn-helix transcriptional regulator [Sneathiella sp.]|nr:helix-turn-helix transcriptional regulator [Sneathiella sp.]